jgi:hypothetical protein
MIAHNVIAALIALWTGLGKRVAKYMDYEGHLLDPIMLRD